MQTVKDRLIEFLREERISASEFSRRMGLSPAYLASMRKSMPLEKVNRLIKEFPQLNRDWLLYGEGEMYRDMGDSEIDPYRLHRHLIPLIPGQAYAGRLNDFAQGYMAEDCARIYSPRPEADIAIQVSGDSMDPKIPDKSIIFVKKLNDALFIPWGVPLLVDTSNGSVVKMLFPSEKGDDYFQAKSINPAYPPYDIPKESINGIYTILCTMTEGFTF